MHATLFGHGYIGEAIAQALLTAKIPYDWRHHEQPAGETDFIINAAGYTGTPNVDACEKDRGNCIRGNITWPLELQHEANRRRIPVLHVSSGCIYTGTAWAFAEEDSPNFTFDTACSFYSGCKAEAERALKPILIESYVLRVRMPFGATPHPKNLLTKLANYAKLVDQLNSISYVPDIARAVITFATQRPAPGIYNCTNPGAVRTVAIADAMQWQKQWFTREEFARHVKAPRSECILDTAKIAPIVPMRPASEIINDIAATYRAAA